VRVPKLLVQPLLENAFRHGVGHYVSGGVVRILADVSEGVLRVEVSDNGPGVSEARLEELRKMIREEKHRSEHLGLRNVHRRLVLNFGPEYGLKVGTSHWGGFEASFTAPADAGNKPTYGTRAEQGLIGQG
jgi:two-component system sensor histidine kinase YesM